MKTELTADRVRELLDYNHETGEFRWRKDNGKARRGCVAGHNHRGYVIIGICGRRIGAHRLAWLYVHGRFPQLQIDHINCNPSDNRISNLREANAQQNNHNKHKASSNSRSGVLGVYWRGDRNKWRAGIRVNREKIWLGYFVNKEDAQAAYLEAKRRLHPFAFSASS